MWGNDIFLNDRLEIVENILAGLLDKLGYRWDRDYMKFVENSSTSNLLDRVCALEEEFSKAEKGRKDIIMAMYKDLSEMIKVYALIKKMKDDLTANKNSMDILYNANFTRFKDTHESLSRVYDEAITNMESLEQNMKKGD